MKEISIEKAKTHNLFYFAATVVVYRESDGKCLLLKRSDKEIGYPGKYAVPGGKMDWADFPKDTFEGDDTSYFDAVTNLLKRETKEEANIEIDDKPLLLKNLMFIRPDGVPVVVMVFASKYVSGEVKLEEHAFSDYVWVDAEEVKQYDCIKGIHEEVAKTIKRYKKD